jgi:hypothetical protein
MVHVLFYIRYGDLNNRSLLLLLVAKGRLGDTFPSTFHCLDMRARNRSEEPNSMMSTLVQELGRLCRYSDVDSNGRPKEDIPYALVSKRTSLERMLPSILLRLHS